MTIFCLLCFVGSTMCNPILLDFLLAFVDFLESRETFILMQIGLDQKHEHRLLMEFSPSYLLSCNTVATTPTVEKSSKFDSGHFRDQFRNANH